MADAGSLRINGRTIYYTLTLNLIQDNFPFFFVLQAFEENPATQITKASLYVR
jgi:hypothetical protein